jgi:hypothetical protein
MPQAFKIYVLTADFFSGFDLENRWGTYKTPVIVEAASGPGTVHFKTYISVIDCRYVGASDRTWSPSPVAQATGGLARRAGCSESTACQGVACPSARTTAWSHCCRYLYFIGINITFAGDEDGDHPFHCESCIGLLMRAVKVRGSNSDGARYKTRVSSIPRLTSSVS